MLPLGLQSTKPEKSEVVQDWDKGNSSDGKVGARASIILSQPLVVLMTASLATQRSQAKFAGNGASQDEHETDGKQGLLAIRNR